jgi:hypothetical protein
MGQTHDEITQNLAERLCWEAARRDDSRVARRLYRKPLVDGVYRLDEGALLDDFFHFLQVCSAKISSSCLWTYHLSIMIIGRNDHPTFRGKPWR